MASTESSTMDWSDLPSIEENKFQSKEIRPLCLEDATNNAMPKSYKTLISNLSEDTLNAYEICIGMLYILAAESGFVGNIVDNVQLNQRYYFFNVENTNSVRTDAFTSGRTEEGKYRFTLYLGAYESFKCTLVIKSFAGLLMVNFYSTEFPLCFSKTFRPSLYVDDNNKLNIHAVKQWCVICKNELFYPMKLHILREAGIKNATLIDLPHEVVIHLTKFVGVNGFLNLCATCHYFNDTFGETTSIWKYYCKTHEFSANKEDSISWKTHFRDQKKLRKDNKKLKKLA